MELHTKELPSASLLGQYQCSLNPHPRGWDRLAYHFEAPVECPYIYDSRVSISFFTISGKCDSSMASALSISPRL